ncbi:hypothetical protein QBC40DRAFT_332302 [Triangularia verruculosa]|uniref:F-box domain-containing protein n=1 Tax=Triangularia verruculosa TaxID=2587418 RepID=A0AAN6XHR2_9PEZI|nr:hypothetical protein QBC40DRAFT_332302 [Triangularia verruculosa]
MTAAHPLAGLPFETLSSIVDYLSGGERACLAGTCRSIRQRLLPFVYHTLTFSNSSVMSDSALLAAQRHGEYVKNLRFVGYAYRSDDRMDTDLWKRPITRRDGGIAEVPYRDITGLKREGGAAVDREEDEDWMGELLGGGGSEDICFPHDYSQQPDFLPLGAEGMFEDLEDEWGWMGRVRKLTIGMGGVGMPEGSQARLLFGLKDNEFHFNWRDYHSHLRLPPLADGKLMPVLEEIRLRNVWVSQAIVDVVVGRKDTLKKLVLENAQACVSQTYPRDRHEKPAAAMSWEAFFDDLCGALDWHPDMALEEFVFTSPVHVDGEVNGKEWNRWYTEEQRDKRAAKRRELRKPVEAARPGTRLFGYGHHHKVFCEGIEATVDSIVEGRDLAAYERFVGKMAAKRERDKYRRVAEQAGGSVL